jgi:hypothetical protein
MLYERYLRIQEKKFGIVGSEVFTAVAVKSDDVFWDMTMQIS